MTNSILRKLYRGLLLLYPEPFRLQFRDDMLIVFDRCMKAQGWWPVFADTLLSAAKQHMHSLCTPAPKAAFPDWEIGSRPNLPRLLAVAAVGACLITSMLVGGKPPRPHFPATVRSKTVFWFPTRGWERYCPDAPHDKQLDENAHLTGVLVAKQTNDLASWEIVGIPCGGNWSDVPEFVREEARLLTRRQTGGTDTVQATSPN